MQSHMNPICARNQSPARARDPTSQRSAETKQNAHIVSTNTRREAQACILTAGRCAALVGTSPACTGHATVSGGARQQSAHLRAPGAQRTAP